MAAPSQLVGQTLGHYRILEQIGAGGMGVVYRAYDNRLDRNVAVKVLPPGALPDERDRKRFRKEAVALAKLNHPNIATIHDFDTQDGTDFLVMEYVVGTTLADKLSSGALPEKQVFAIGEQVAKALECAHANAMVHRDLPAIVLWADRDTSVIVPWSERVNSTQIRSNAAAGKHLRNQLK